MATPHRESRKAWCLLGERNLIFVTVGTSPHEFKRLLAGADRAITSLGQSAIFQVGISSYEPRSATKTYEFMTREAYLEAIQQCNVVVSHGGIGALLSAIRANRPVILMPRRKRLGEIDNDHQVEIAEIVQALGTGVKAWVVDDEEGLLQSLEQALLTTGSRTVERGILKTRILESIRAYAATLG